jgi:hypothetical protein
MADPSTSPPLTRASVQAALKLIEPYVHKTPVLTNTSLNRLASTPRTAAELEGTEWAGQTPAKPVLRFWFKCENLQKIGAFKARGAFHAIERLKLEPGWEENGGREKGVVTHSSGEFSYITVHTQVSPEFTYPSLCPPYLRITPFPQVLFRPLPFQCIEYPSDAIPSLTIRSLAPQVTT